MIALDWVHWYSDSQGCARPAESWPSENLNPSHLEIFSLTRLAIAFEFFDDEQAAMNSFFPDRAMLRYDILDFVEHEDDRSSKS